MSKPTALGLELDWEDDEDFDQVITPVNALVVAEGMNHNGETVHVVMVTPGMTTVHGSGFVQFARQWLDLYMMNEIVRASTPKEEL